MTVLAPRTEPELADGPCGRGVRPTGRDPARSVGGAAGRRGDTGPGSRKGVPAWARAVPLLAGGAVIERARARALGCEDRQRSAPGQCRDGCPRVPVSGVA